MASPVQLTPILAESLVWEDSLMLIEKSFSIQIFIRGVQLFPDMRTNNIRYFMFSTMNSKGGSLIN